MGRDLSLPALRVLRFFLEAPQTPRYGLEISAATGTKTGALYPILSRLEARNWIVGRWEELDERSAGRRKRRYYVLTGVGETSAADVVMRASADLRPADGLRTPVRRGQTA